MKLLAKVSQPIKDLQTGHALVSEINAAMAKALIEMRMTADNAMHQELTDYRYELLQARRNVQSQMLRLAKEKRGL